MKKARTTKREKTKKLKSFEELSPEEKDDMLKKIAIRLGLVSNQT